MEVKGERQVAVTVLFWSHFSLNVGQAHQTKQPKLFTSVVKFWEFQKRTTCSSQNFTQKKSVSSL